MDSDITPHKAAVRHATTGASFAALIAGLYAISSGEHLPIVATIIVLAGFWISCYVVDRWLI